MIFFLSKLFLQFLLLGWLAVSAIWSRDSKEVVETVRGVIQLGKASQYLFNLAYFMWGLRLSTIFHFHYLAAPPTYDPFKNTKSKFRE